VVRSPTEAFCNNFEWRNPVSPELDNIENGETPESGQKTPISSETFNIENLQLQKKSIFIGIIQ
jgi:hypothetical protein